MVITMFIYIKNLRGFYDLTWEDGYPPDIIQYDSYWAFRWGYQSELYSVIEKRKLSSSKDSKVALQKKSY